jgi:Ca-activated chloride channel family protein
MSKTAVLVFLVFFFNALIGMLAFGQAPDLGMHMSLKTPREMKPVAGREQTVLLPAKPIECQVDLVLVPLSVTDTLNQTVTDLRKEDFQVLEDGRVQQVRYFSQQEEPLSIGIILDMSRSVRNKEVRIREAVREFLLTANPDDEFFLVTFANKPRLVTDWTRSVEDLQFDLLSVAPSGNTSLLDAVYMGLQKLRKVSKTRRKALLVISDGGDNHSRFTTRDVKHLAMESDVQIYSVGVFSPFKDTKEEDGGPRLLSSISQATGGRLYDSGDITQLPYIAANIGKLLRTQFVLGYLPNDKPRDGRWHKIKLKLLARSAPFSVAYKRGYYAVP